jgi:hypothetical protein
MAQQLLTFESTLPPDDVTERAADFFTNQRWCVQSQSPRVCTVIGVAIDPVDKVDPDGQVYIGARGLSWLRR